MELARQVETLVRKGYPALLGLTDDELRRRLADLPERAGSVLVVPIPRHDAVPAMELRGKPGFTDMTPEDLAGFAPTEHVDVPGGLGYLLLDPDTGRETLNVTPDDALPTILARGRSPLTIDEGIALVTHRPELLARRECFSLLGSRRGDRRVPALWVKSSGHPRLGWCWAGNPHTWLGSASGAGRVGTA